MKILIGADLCPTEKTEKLFVEKRKDELFGSMMNLVKASDRFVINLECALTDSDGAIRKYGPNLKASPLCADALKEFGVTDVMLSNNHVYDFGEKGLRDTLAALDRVGLPYTGVGENDLASRKPYFIEGEGKKIAFINVCEHEYCYALPDAMGANPFDPFLTMHDIREAKKSADFVIVIYHGGKEYSRYPSERLYRACHEMVECGADVVLTQHSHCIGCYEEYEGAHIVYGQGNLNFVMPSSLEEWYTSLLVELEVKDKISIKFYPLVTLDTGIDVARGAKAAEIMNAFYERNEELKNGKWLAGFEKFCMLENMVGYRDCLTNCYNENSSEEQNELFAHYLDCEAHTDVWRVRFPTWHKTERKKNSK